MRIFGTLLLLFPFVFSNAQDPHFRTLPIADSGCSFYSPMDGYEFVHELSPDSSDVWTGEMQVDSSFFAVICVRFNFSLEGDTELKNEILVQYLDFLKEQFLVTQANGYTTGHTLVSYPGAIGMSDHWKDDDEVIYDVKAWCNDEYLAVMCIYSYEQPPFSVAEAFHNGFQFP